MAIQASCPHCEATFRLPDTAAGKKFRCKECEEVFPVGKNGKRSSDTRIQSKSAGRKPRAADDEDDDEDDEEQDEEQEARKSKKKKKKKGKKSQGSAMPLILAGGGAVLLIAVGVVVFMMMGSGTPVNQPAENQPPAIPPEKKGGPPPAQIALPAIDPKDPVAQQLAILKLDAINRQAEILAAVDWFKDPLRSQTYHPRDKDKKQNHPKRDDVAKALELLIDHPAYELRDECWEAWTRWVTNDHLEAVKLHMHRAPKSEYRVLIMNSLARFNTEESIEVLAMCLAAPERAVAAKLLEALGAPYLKNIKPGVAYRSIKELPPNPVARKVEPYIYHADEEIRELTFSVLKKFMVDRDWLPRLPPPDDNIDLDSIVPILTTAETEFDGPFWFRSSQAVHDEPRLKKLGAMGWLQKQLLSGTHWKSISEALDPMVSSKDQFKRYNALLCLERWASKTNIGSLSSGLGDKLVKKEHPLMVEIITKIPDPEAGTALVPKLADLLPDLDSRLISKLGDYLRSLSAPDAMKATLIYFNHEDKQLQNMSRAAVAVYRMRSGEQLTNDDVIQQCLGDLGGEKTRSAAIGWLASSSPPADRMLRKQATEQLMAIAQEMDNPIRGGAQATLSKWGSTPVKTP